MISIHRIYRNGDLWQESTRLRASDIPLIRFLLDEAHTWVIEQCGSDRSHEESGS